jgi:glycosyltransferase involved in cell wall biosynthesis
MSTTRRLSICYAAPGHRLVGTSGATRNILALAAALSELADVTVVFRHVPRGAVPPALRVLAVEPGDRGDAHAVDDIAHGGLNPLDHLRYLGTLAAFARRPGHAFDVVLEKGWRLSGTLAAAFRRRGIPGVLVENDVRSWSEPIRDVRTAVKYLLHRIAEPVARRHWSRVPIIAETDELKTMLVARGADAARVDVIGLGVDHALFRPRDQAEARRALGLEAAGHVLVYVGAMDKYHDLGPVIEGLAAAAGPVRTAAGPVLHVVGDGCLRAECERLATRRGAAVAFHGRVPHASIPTYIAAADACVTAYRERAFPGATVPFSTLKVPEYMACARPVVGSAAGQARALLEHGISAVLFPNDVSAWARFFRDVPPREQLAEMGRAAAKAAESISWDRTAARYLDVCERVVAGRGRGR